MATKFHFLNRVEKVKPHLHPPVSNHMLFNNDLKIMIVGGPNQRKDFHTQMGEELFYQIVGDMDLVIINPKTGCQEPVHIKEGEIFLLPAGVSHSPQRYANTLGLVLERSHTPEEMDNLRWHTDADPNAVVLPDAKAEVLYQEYFHCLDLGTEIKAAIERFQHFLKLPVEERPKLDFSHVHNIQGLVETMKNAKHCNLQPPFPLETHLQTHSESKDSAIFDSEFVLKQFRHFSDERSDVRDHHFTVDPCFRECYLWQYKGNAVVHIENDSRYELAEGESLFLPKELMNCNVCVHTANKNDITLFFANKFPHQEHSS